MPLITNVFIPTIVLTGAPGDSTTVTVSVTATQPADKSVTVDGTVEFADESEVRPVNVQIDYPTVAPTLTIDDAALSVALGIDVTVTVGTFVAGSNNVWQAPLTVTIV